MFRLDGSTGKVARRIRLGTVAAYNIWVGGGSLWVADDQAAVIAGDAPERMVWLRGRLWITGRGTDLLKVDPQTIDIGVSGIDVAGEGDSLWVPTRNAAVNQRGFPTMDALKRVSATSGAVSTVAQAADRVDVHGIAARAGVVWLADNTGGRLYRIA